MKFNQIIFLYKSPKIIMLLEQFLMFEAILIRYTIIAQ